MFIKVLACRGFENRTVPSVMPGKFTAIRSPIGLVQYEGEGYVLPGKYVVIRSTERASEYGDRRTEQLRRIPVANVVSMEMLQ